MFVAVLCLDDDLFKSDLQSHTSAMIMATVAQGAEQVIFHLVQSHIPPVFMPKILNPELPLTRPSACQCVCD